eukprot:jgi/Psemu1/23297/gm1.23297_g
MAKKGRRLGVINYSRTEVLELLHTLKAILPVGPEEWAQVGQIHKDNFPDTNQSVANLRRKYSNLYRKKVPTGNPNCPKQVKLAKKVKWLIKSKQGVGGGEEHYDMVEGYQNNMEDEESSANPTANTAANTAANPANPTVNGANPANPAANPANITAASSTPRSKRQYHKNINGRQDILDFLRENSKLEGEQRREDHWLEREHREAAFQAQRQQTEAALELLKAAIVDVATIFLNGLRPNSNSNPPPAGNST